MMRSIHYRIDRDTGMVWSQVFGEGWAIPVYQFSDFGNDGDFTGEIPVKLEKFDTFAVSCRLMDSLIYTKKIPREIKNCHRKFWGMKELK